MASNRPKEGDTLRKLLNDASDDEKAMFLTVLVHGVVAIDGLEDVTQDLLLNGYLVSTDPPDSYSETGSSRSNLIDELGDIMADVRIDNYHDGNVGDTTQDDHIYEASIFEVFSL